MRFDLTTDSLGQLCKVYPVGRGKLAKRLYVIGVRGKQELSEGYLEAGTYVNPVRKPSEPEPGDGPLVLDHWVYVSQDGATYRTLYSALKKALSPDVTELTPRR